MNSENQWRNKPVIVWENKRDQQIPGKERRGIKKVDYGRRKKASFGAEQQPHFSSRRIRI